MKRALRTTDDDMLADQAREAYAAAIRDKRCSVCGAANAGLGIGFNGKRMELGRWFCAAHADEWRAYQQQEAKR